MGVMPPMVQRVSDEGNMDPQKESLPMGGKGGREGEGRSEPVDRKTELLFLRFFHLARRFWNHTWNKQKYGISMCLGRSGREEEEILIMDGKNAVFIR